VRAGVHLLRRHSVATVLCCAVQSAAAVPCASLTPHLLCCVQVVRGVYMGGFTAAKAGVADGTYKPEQFKWYIRWVRGGGAGCMGAVARHWAGVWVPLSILGLLLLVLVLVH
jgi:hypothetical protein